MKEKTIDCLHYDEEFGCCKILSDWSNPMPTLQPCVESPCKYYEQECEFCKEGDEKCGTCEEMYKGMDGCSSRCDTEKCFAYKPVNYCFMCGRKLRGGE